jgi:plastin-1
VHDGFLLCTLCNLASPDALDERVIAIGKKLNTFSVLANIMLALGTAKSFGPSIVNMDQPDIRGGTPHLVVRLV